MLSAEQSRMHRELHCIGLRYVHRMQIVTAFAAPVDAAVAAIELVGEGDKDVSVKTPDGAVHRLPFDKLLPRPGYAHA